MRAKEPRSARRRASINRKLDAAIHFGLLPSSEGGRKSITCGASRVGHSCAAYSTRTTTSACGPGRWCGVPQGTFRHPASQTEKLVSRTRARIAAANSPTTQTPHSCGLLPCSISGFSFKEHGKLGMGMAILFRISRGLGMSLLWLLPGEGFGRRVAYRIY